MAPNRRKSASKAAAAAAARRKWKVGDLVLAKVKGFPAWPAMVSEPEKWGYTADWRKVTVHFFGTGQIAFCNPVDVEEFTEEKKVSLLGKRHGKGADFVRAVNEIINCFEDLNKLDQVSSVNATEETSVTNENNSEGSLSKPEKDEAPVITVKSLSTGAANDLNSLTEAAASAAAEDTLHDEMQLEDAPSNKVFNETPVATYYSTRSKTDVAQSRSDAQRRISARRLRSSSRIDANRLRKSASPSLNNARSSRRLGATQLHDRSLRRSKRIMKSSDDSEGHDVDSPANISNDSIEDNDSEIMSIDSDRQSYNDGSTVDSSCQQAAAEPLSDNNGGETELSDRLEFQTNTLIIKKKRQTNRKRHSNDTVVAAKLDVVVPEAEVLKVDCFSPCDDEKSVKLPVKDDGDEHLPLVKRARVRMGRPSPEGEQENALVCKEEKVVVFPESHAMSSGPLNLKVDARDGESVPSNGDQPNVPLSHVNPSKKPQFWESIKIDGEAALPPSKRLHRALEAMSANVAEDCQRASNCLPTVNTDSNGCSTSSFVKCSEQLIESKVVNELGSGPMKDHRNSDSQFSDSEIFVGSNIEMLEGDSATVVDCGKISCSVNSSDHETCKGVYELAEGAGSKRLKMSLSNEHLAEVVAVHHSVKPDLPSICEEIAHSGCNTPGLVLSPTDCCKIEGEELNKPAKGLDPEISQVNSDAILVEGIAPRSLNIDTGIQSAGSGDETQESKFLPLIEDNQGCQRSEFAKEAKTVSMDSKVMPSVTPFKALNDSHHQSLLHSNSISDNYQDRTVSVTQSSSSLTDGPDSAARGTPPSSSTCNISASDNSNYLENHSSCSPDVQLHLEKAKLAGKSSSKGESLLSFEAAIRSLTRTKESIGRATRIAIDCAKSGFATKIVEILARNLESESSSHKKVDLFFLVDSITQCSRGMKGDGGIYPSAIQPLLPRLLLAAAPPGSTSHENHRQCLKVLRVWQERSIIPEPIIRHHIRELDALCGSYPIVGSRRPQRNERAFDDPIREMEGMVDEYGSNSSLKLPGFCMPPMLKDDDVGSDSDGESFEAVTPEHNVDNLDGQKTLISAVEKRGHILEDVEGELEMEDVAPYCEVEVTSSNTAGAEHIQMSHHQSHNHNGAPFAPQQPLDVPLTSAPLTMSSLPPPPPPPPPPPHPVPPSVFPPAVCDSVTNHPDSKLYPTYQNLNGNVRESTVKQPILPKVKPTTGDTVHQQFHDDTDFEPRRTRQMPECSNTCSFSDQPTSRLSGRANSFHPADGAFSTGFHLRPPHPAPSNQFSYVQEQRIQSRRDIPPPTHHNRFRTRNAENGNFYRDRDRNKFVPRDNVGKCWRPPLPPNSDPCYHDDPRMAHAPMSYSGPPREPSLPDSRWNYPPPPVNHRHFNSYRPPSGGPIPVANRGPNYWRPR